MKVMAVDLGDRHTGVALSDPSGTLPGEAFTINESNETRLTAELCRLAAEKNASRIVVGNPKNMNNTEGERSARCAAFAKRLERAAGLPVLLWDERQTSVTANRILSDAGKKRKKQKARVDAVAATLILQAYLDYLRLNPPADRLP